MFTQANLDERFLDRRGCGDELYADAWQKASSWLADLQGVRALLPSAGLDFDDEGAFDDAAAH